MTTLLYAGCPEAPIQGISGYREAFMSFYMPPSALTGRARGMDSIPGLSLPKLPYQCCLKEQLLATTQASVALEEMGIGKGCIY